ncbi:HNH endonuclease [Maribacter sp. SA7]|uniref:HNH endonuclease n=1 Tax=Maribacter zhoushanensis TaxID=3030012 RepID=UPI0023EAD956|nr:HNH endonuclease [Maribacter zhoushanensis]MDF4204884.1 HNH endonuclease [Maribacter zhoushanensis]
MNKRKIFNAIEQSSEKIIGGKDGLIKRIKSAKNYVSNDDLTEWAFSKLVATENFNISSGSSSKPFFYSHNFKNVLEINDSQFKSDVIAKFLKWSDKIEYIDIRRKFNADQGDKKRFELLVHIDLIPEGIKQQPSFSANNQDEFLEGFKKEIKTENSYRSGKLVKLAKEKYGTDCVVCGFSFEQKYGQHGKDFIEIHHLIPIENGTRKSTINDVAPVCSNCHRMLHKGKTMLSIEYLKEIIEREKPVANNGYSK